MKLLPAGQEAEASALRVKAPAVVLPAFIGNAVAGAAITPLPLRTENPAFEWDTPLRANVGASLTARVRARTWLTIGQWHGSIDIAAAVAGQLVDNAARHARPFDDGSILFRLIVTADTHELLVEVDDAFPEFPDFATVARQFGAPSGLWWVAHHGGRLSCAVKKDNGGAVVGKTVQAVLRCSIRTCLRHA